MIIRCIGHAEFLLELENGMRIVFDPYDAGCGYPVIPVEADAVLIDGNPVGAHPREVTIVKGDAKVACIAAASIVAKVTRDRMMKEYAEEYPYYAFEKNKGYGTKAHYEGIREHGMCPIHRRSFLKTIH